MKNNNSDYIRDGRSPLPLKDSISKIMRANKSKNTKPEITLRKSLWKCGVRGYRLHWSKVPGKPDIAFPSKKIAIFVNGCFWHRCPNCNLPLPKSNVEFWNDKFKKNVDRDYQKKSLLEKSNWKVLIVWECEIKNDLERCIAAIRGELQ